MGPRVKALLDTQALLWWFGDDASLSAKAKRAISSADNEILVSAASVWEISIKNKSGKLEAQELLDGLERELSDAGFVALPISHQHALRAGSLVTHHKDPFDRMLIAQAQTENLPLISNDSIFDRYGIRRIW